MHSVQAPASYSGSNGFHQSSAWGLIGYAIHVAGAIAEIFGIHISLVLLIPGGLFELALGFWLLIKGFQPEAYGQES